MQLRSSTGAISRYLHRGPLATVAILPSSGQTHSFSAVKRQHCRRHCRVTLYVMTFGSALVASAIAAHAVPAAEIH